MLPVPPSRSSHSFSKTLSIVGLFALVLILPVSILFLNNTTENRNQASTGDSTITISSPYINFNATELRVTHGENEFLLTESDLTRFTSNPLIHDNQERLRLSTYWQVSGDPMQIDFTFSKADGYWLLVESLIGYDPVGNDNSDVFLTDDQGMVLEGVLGMPTTRNDFRKIYKNTFNANSTITLQIETVTTQPFLYTFPYQTTPNGYLIENRPESDTSDGKAQAEIGGIGFETAILRDGSGNIVKDQSDITYEWSINSETITITPNEVTTSECIDLGINTPCPAVQIAYTGTADESNTIHLVVKKQGNILAEADFPIVVGNGTPIDTSAHPIDISTPYVSLKADDFYIESQNQRYYFSDVVSRVHSSPEKNNNGFTTLELEWTNSDKPLRMYLYFNQVGNTWTVSELRITVPEGIFSTQNTSLGAGKDSTLSRGEYHETLQNMNAENTNTILVHFSNLLIDPFNYKLQIPQTESGYFIENAPEGSVTGITEFAVGSTYAEHAVLRNAEGNIVTDQSSFTYQWSTQSTNIEITPDSTSCAPYNIQNPCPPLAISYYGKSEGDASVHLAVSQNGQVLAEQDFPIKVFPAAQIGLSPLDINTPYFTLRASDFRVKYQDTTYFFHPSDLEYFYSDPGRDAEGNDTLSVGIRWRTNSLFRLGMYFMKIGNEWMLTDTDFGGTAIDDNATFENNDEIIYAKIGSTFTSKSVEQELVNMLNPNHTLFISYSDLSLQPFKYYLEIPSAESGYFIENPPYGNESGIAVTALNERGIETAILRDNEGNIVIDQSSFTYHWSTTSSNITLIENTPQFCFEDFGIQQPCPPVKIEFTPVSVGPATIHLSVMQGDVEVAQADFPVIVGPVVSPLPSQPVTIIPACPADTRSTGRKADFNNDNKVNLSDYSILVRDFLKTGTNKADANCDGKINLTDYSILVRDFLK